MVDRVRIKRLGFRNVRLFGDTEQFLDFDPNKNVTVLLGNNGSGKSTILDASSILLSIFSGSFPGNALKNFKDTDVHLSASGQLSDYLKCSLELGIGDNVYSIVRYRRGTGKTPPTDTKMIRVYAEDLKTKILSGQKDVSLPILAYYGTSRGQIKAPERRRDFQKAFAQWDCYNSALEASTDFKRFFSWYDLMEDEERREREKRRDFNYKSKILCAVRQAIESFVMPKYGNPRIEIHPLRFALDEYNDDGEKRTLRLEQFSDGYKIVIAMVADIASRMAEGNPYLENPLLASGIILIDEIDLHLHPKWQRHILQSLHDTFPNVQFIVTTHSPIILIGAASIAQVIKLSGDSIHQEQVDLNDYDVSQILLSDLFGLDSVQAPVYDKDIARQKELLEKYDSLTEDEKVELEDIDKRLSHLSYGTSVDEMKTRRLIDRLAEQLKV